MADMKKRFQPGDKVMVKNAEAVLNREYLEYYKTFGYVYISVLLYEGVVLLSDKPDVRSGVSCSIDQLSHYVSITETDRRSTVKNMLILPEHYCIQVSRKTKVRTAIVSIVSTESPDANIDVSNPSIVAVFRMRFNDLETDLEKFKAPTKADFVDLKDFIDSLEEKQVDLLIVSCEAGISRSAGVGGAIDEYLGLDYDVWNNPLHIPNIWVYQLACEELRIARTQEEMERIFENRREMAKKYVDDIDDGWGRE